MAHNYFYERLNRLTTTLLDGPDATADYLYTYNYDRLGNITSRTGTDPDMTYSYGSSGTPPAVTGGPQAVTRVDNSIGTDWSYDYDTRGNLDGKYQDTTLVFDYTFDAENRLASVRTNNQTMSFAYDADGQRVMTTRHDGTILFTPFPDYEVEDPPGSGANTTRTTYRIAGQIVAVQTKVGTQNGVFYYTYTNHLGNVMLLSDLNGTPIDTSLARYDPFGNYRTRPATTTNPTITNHGFTGHKHNNTGEYPTQNVGLIYMNARYYLPEVGRFISPDSIVPDPTNPQSYNRYTYVRNDPVNLIDPSGHMETDGCDISSCGLGASSSDYLWQTSDGQLVPWDPTLVEPRYEAKVYGASGTIRSGVFGLIGYSMSIGVDVLRNYESGEVTSYLYYSENANSRSIGASGNGAVYVGGVNNLNGSNYNYRGVARTVNASASAGPLGLTTGYTFSLDDDPLDPQYVWSEYIGWAPGVGASVGVSDAIYVPIFTNNLETGTSSWDILKYAQEQWQMTIDDFSGAWTTLQDWFR